LMGVKRKVDLRKEAKGRACQIRIPGKCTHNNEETVLCHLRMAGVTGAGQKAHDMLGAWGCNRCHAIIDGREITSIPYEQIRIMFYEGMVRTLNILIKEGKIG